MSEIKVLGMLVFFSFVPVDGEGGPTKEGRKGSRWMAFGPLSRVEVREGGLIGGEKD